MGSLLHAPKVERIVLDAATYLTGSEVNTPFTFPTKAIALGSWIDVITGHGSTATMDVGTGGTSNDPDGLLDGVDIETAGVIVPNLTETTGLNETYISALTFGALTHALELGTDVAGNTGYVTPRGTSVGGDVVSVTSAGDYSSGSAEIHLYIMYLEL